VIGALIPVAILGLFSLSGLYFLLKAVWALRLGQHEARFLSSALLGVILLALPWFLLLSFSIPFTGHLTQATQSQSYTSP
jgi:hypothetical protein